MTTTTAPTTPQAPGSVPDRSAPLAAELLKLRRSQALVVVLGLPIVIALAGIVNTLSSGQGLADGWNTLWVRTLGFHGLFPLTLGVAILASLVWRAEHRDGNWNALMTSPVDATRTVMAKAAAVAVLAAAMQAVMLTTILVIGKAMFGLSGLPAPHLLASGALVTLACAPLAAFQSALAMLMRSFAAPVAVGAVLAGVSVVLLTAGLGEAAYALPHALAARTALLGSGMFGETGVPDPATFLALAVAAVVQMVLVVGTTGHVLGNRDTRA